MPEQNNNRRNILIIVIAVIVIAVILFFVWWQFFRKTEEPVVLNNTQPTTNQAVVATVNANPAEINVNLDTTVEVTENLSMISLANIFTERFGSFSSETEFQNTLDLKSFMTASMKVWADNLINFQENVGSGDFSSIISKVISTKIISSSDSAAIIEIVVKRTESSLSNDVDTSYYQNMVIELVKQGDDWKVDTATWGDKI